MKTFTIEHNLEMNKSSIKKSYLEYCMMNCLGKQKSYLFRERAYKLKKNEQEKFNGMVRALKSSIPVAYVLGNQPFFNYTFEVNSNVLIPRPETEIMISHILDCGDKIYKKSGNMTILDLGTGSGCIGLTLAAERKNWNVILTEKFYSCADIIKQNMFALKVNNCHLIIMDWLRGLRENLADIIVSNPPYIEYESILVDDNVKNFEPNTALFAEEKGLSDIKKIIESSQETLKENGYLFLENGYDQSDDVVNLLREHDYRDIQVFMDYNKIHRFTCSRKI